jgi:dihydroneopterin aldolase
MAEIIAAIVLKGFEVSASIGVHDHERAARQRIVLDVEITVDQAARPETDTIDQVLDYDFIREEVHALLAARHYDLQESLCYDILDFCLARPEVVSATVYSRKPDIYPDCDSVGFRLSARR